MRHDSSTLVIPLTQEHFALVDVADYSLVRSHSWYLTAQGYAGANIYGGGRRKARLMHRVILGIVDSDFFYTDHINGDRLDNRRCNLRVVTPTENSMNRPGRGGSSRYKGVHWHKGGRRWRAMIMVGRKGQHLGYFDTEIEAATAYDARAWQLFGDVARLNFPRTENAPCIDLKKLLALDKG